MTVISLEERLAKELAGRPLGCTEGRADDIAEESAPDYPDLDDDADETDGGEAVDPNTGEIK